MEGLKARARKLAAAARALNARGSVAAPFQLAFLTDETRGPRADLVARVLPAGSALVLRDYHRRDRAGLARRLREITAARGVLLIVGEDEALARESGADGLHLRSTQLKRPPVRTTLLRTAACHGAADLAAAARTGAMLAFLSPVFPTQSHPSADGLGVERFHALASASRIPVLGLGGVDERNAPLLAGSNVVGFGAIGAFCAR